VTDKAVEPHEGQTVPGTPGKSQTVPHGIDGARLARPARDLPPLPPPRQADVPAIVETEVSWDFPPGLVEEARKRAVQIRRKWRGVVDLDDLLQEGLIFAALHPATLAAHLADPAKGLDYFGWAMQSRMNKVCEREHRLHSSRCVSYDACREDVGDDI
jgi:hypothetical protein